MAHVRVPMAGMLLLVALVVISLFAGSVVAADHYEAQFLFINEVMASNGSTIADGDGDFPDWIELYNASNVPLDLSGYYLSDDEENPLRWQFPSGVIAPDGYLLVWASGKDMVGDDGALHTNFAISASGEPILLTKPDGKTVVDHMAAVQMPRDISYGRVFDGASQWTYFAQPTPSNGNHKAQGFTHPKVALSVVGGSPYADIVPVLCINEVMASNGSTIADGDGDFPDWIELYNASSEVVDLTGYYLSDDENNPLRWQFPQGTIEPRGYLIIWASGKDMVGDDGALHTNFAISASGEPIILVAPDGETRVDYVPAVSMPRDVSFGRIIDGSGKWTFFGEPTPGKTNRSAAEFVPPPEPPEFSHAGGFFTQGFSLELIAAPGLVIYYTLDGSEPTTTRLGRGALGYQETHAYEGPLHIETRKGDANLFSAIRTTDLIFPWFEPWRGPAGEVFKATVVRAAAFDPQTEQYSPTVTHTYFVDEDMLDRYPTLPVISLVSDYDHLFHPDTGIYVPGTTHRGDPYQQNFFQGWRRPANIEFFESSGNLGFSGVYEIRNQGSSSPASFQKGLHVTARRDLGDNRIWYPIFENGYTQAREQTEFKRFIIRGWGSSRTTNRHPIFFSDAYHQTLLAEFDLEIQDYRPAIVFINGEYWGLHDLREANKNSWYHHFRTGIDRDDPGFDLLDGGGNMIDEGDSDHWDAMIAFIESNDMRDPDNYAYIQTQMDVDNFILYIVHNVYLGKRDWPDQNEAKWRPRTEDGRWRWTQFDMDHGFNQWSGPHYDMINHVLRGDPQRPGGHPLFRELIVNEEFKIQFINTMADLMNTALSTRAELAHFDRIAAELDPYMEEFQHRWSYNYNWEQDLEIVRNTIRTRRDYRIQQMLANFNLPGTANITIATEPEMGTVRVNSVLICETTPGVWRADSWTGVYFRGVPIEITAVPRPGYRFTGWWGLDDDSEHLTITPTRNMSFWPEFAPEN